MNGRPDWDNQFAESEDERNCRLATKRKAHAAIATQARKTAAREVKSRAREYLAESSQLDMLRPGYDASLFTPEQLVEFGEQLLKVEIMYAIPLCPVRLINARAAIVAGRWKRKYVRAM